MPDQQIIKGTTYSDGDNVNATNLNEHVDNARLASGAITGQAAATSVALTDELLINQSASLKKATLTQVQTAIASDYLKKDGSVNMTTGQLNLYSTAQLANLNAVSLGHLNYNFIKNSGSQIMSGSLAFGTSELVKLNTSGISMLTTVQLVTLSRNPLNALEAAPKQYVDGLLAPQRLKCKGYFSNTTNLNPPSNLIDTSKYLSVSASRVAGSQILTINFSSLNSKYQNLESPFFLKGQYIGLNSGVTGIPGRLHEILSVNNTAKTLTVNTTSSYTTAFSGTVQLTVVYDNADNNDALTYNCKSVYLCCQSNKIYVNYWADEAGSKINESPTRALNSIITGQGHTYNYSVMSAREMTYLFLRTDWQFEQNVPEGFGSTNTGCHLGYFYSDVNGTDNAYYYRANFAIM